ncbi:dTDP-4-dehydrorhamnose 3,5-epimerase [Catalinimonas alkaloidigena]|uniref:dTDP-4-dehydrorhamnose 3,5-epimerase n=1 Tax=Catalinimonas alkaloidigena TaxID=1075417 RepID=UPI00240727EF|nr:dTDP-4-dehydrorhamnose 3,5-epimerase [Catalinimonas alkaloidigena]MDF9795752.1 dTDP-4-dehydrorhamnose 3,5-epimerase [Catalinimonas alkaloidigena]
MIFTETKLAGAYILDLKKIGDERGFFSRAFCANEYKEHGLNPTVAQANLSRSEKKHTLRGFHYQVEGAEEAKTIRCVKGKLLDVIIDLRKDSPTYCQYVAVELSDENHRALYVPEHFAHSFITLEDHTEAYYLVSNFYAPGKERGIRWNDPYFNVEWPTDQPIVSEKDQNHPDFQP